MAKKQKLSVRVLESRLRDAEFSKKMYEQNAAWYLKLKDRETALRADALRAVAEAQTRIGEQARENGDLLNKCDAYERLLRANDAACEKLQDRNVELDKKNDWLQGQINTLNAHRESLLDAMATVRFVAEERAQGRLG